MSKNIMERWRKSILGDNGERNIIKDKSKKKLWMDPLGKPDKNGVRKRVPRKIVYNAKLARDFRP